MTIENVKYYLEEFYIYKKTGNIKGYNKIDRNELGGCGPSEKRL